MEKKEMLGKCLTPNTKLISWREIDGEIVYLHKEKREFYELNGAGNLIWKQAVKKNNVAGIIKALKNKYNKIDEGILRKDAIDFINELIEEKIFLVSK